MTDPLILNKTIKILENYKELKGRKYKLVDDCLEYFRAESLRR